MKFLYRLLFTRDDDLDLLQILFLGWVVFLSLVIWKDSSGAWDVSTGAWSLIGTVFGSLILTGTPMWIARLIAKAPQDVKSPEIKTYHSFEEADAAYYSVDEPPDGA